jgi:hypothetical protein
MCGVADAASPQAPFPVAPVYVSVTGSHAIRLRIWAGNAMPCDSGLAKLLDAKVKPGFETTLWTDAQSVCVEQTDATFPDVGWSAPKIIFRNAICLKWIGSGKYRRCDQWAIVPVNVAVTSNPPKP